MEEAAKKSCLRSKRVCQHPNPLFEKWLLEWKKEAEEHRSNNKYNLQRAILSLRKFPLPVYSGDDCKILANFGDKICKKIDKKLSQFIAENGPINWDDYIKVTNIKKKGSPRRKKNELSHKATRQAKSTSMEAVKHLQKRRAREYIPAYRSGAYALLIALSEASQDEDFPGYLKKEELIEAAQPLTDASFTLPPMGSHYTAFSSMSTLIKKGLARREGNPSRYSLTEEGDALAQRICNGQPFSSLDFPQSRDEDYSTPSELCSQPERLKSPVKVHELSSSDEESDLEVTFVQSNDHTTTEPSTPATSTGGDISQDFNGSTSSLDNSALRFVYVDVLGRDTILKDKASVHVDLESRFFGFSIKCKLSDLLGCKLDYQLDYSRRAAPSMTYAYLADDCAPQVSPGLGGGSKDDPDHPKKTTPQKAMNSFRTENHVQDVGPLPKKKAKIAERQVDGAAVLEEPRPQSSCSSMGSEVISPIQCASRYSLLPGSFKVVLCVDNQEVVSGMSSAKGGTKEIIIKELKKHSVEFHVRKLHVGDFLWVCQEVNTTGKPRELVLPFIIERKRMDDLAQSIKDGRFKEQKFRLKQTGLAHPIYLVEQFGSNYLSIPLSTCQQAIANTQIIDNFHVKVTLDQKESAAYLTVMTRHLQGLFKRKTLQCIRHSDLGSCSQELSATQCSLVEFEELNSFSMKNRQLSVRDMFAKHLLQLSGLSVDKAAAILEKYPTPHDLMTALSKCDEEAKANLLAPLKCPLTGRALGPALSAQLSRLYSRERIF